MNSSESDDNLTSAEAEELHRLEAVVQRALDTEGELGRALVDLSKSRLYRHTHGSFETYLRDRWGESEADAPLAELRWLLTQSSGTLADVVHQVETGSADLDDDARQQLRDDLLVLDEELAMLKALLAVPGDWDAEYARLLAGEIPPFEHEDEDEDVK